MPLLSSHGGVCTIVWCRYAKDNELFRKDFAAAFQKLEELGTKNLKPVAL